jgi:hypothetical protein
MADPGSLNLFTIPPNKGFADALADGLIARHGSDPLALARGLILLPNNRAIRGLTQAFVRRSGGGLLLPRLVTIGDEELGEDVGLALDPADASAGWMSHPSLRRIGRRRSNCSISCWNTGRVCWRRWGESTCKIAATGSWRWSPIGGAPTRRLGSSLPRVSATALRLPPDCCA